MTRLPKARPGRDLGHFAVGSLQMTATTCTHLATEGILSVFGSHRNVKKVDGLVIRVTGTAAATAPSPGAKLILI